MTLKVWVERSKRFPSARLLLRVYFFEPYFAFRPRSKGMSMVCTQGKGVSHDCRALRVRTRSTNTCT